MVVMMSIFVFLASFVLVCDCCLFGLFSVLIMLICVLGTSFARVVLKVGVLEFF